MLATPVRTGGVSPFVLATTMAFIFLGVYVPGMLAAAEPFLVLGLMLLIGLPHGATDHGLFLALTGGEMGERKVSFYFLYALVIGAYGLLWLVFPVVAFVLFMLLSVYHFGQSNWADVRYPNAKWGTAHYLLWGAGVLLAPILLYADQAAAIVSSMTSDAVSYPSAEVALGLIIFLALANLVFLLLLRWRGAIGKRRLLLEVVGYSLLLAMFFTNSLLLGFTVYFVFWHSLASAQDQLRFFRRRLSCSVRRQLYFGILTTVGGALAFCLVVWLGPGPAAALAPEVIGGVFVFISLLTLPHMLLVEKLYRQWSPAAEGEHPAAQHQETHSERPPTGPRPEWTILH